MKRIMFVYDLNYKGGVETLILRLSRHLRNENNEVNIWTKGMDNGELCQELLSYGVNILDVSSLSKREIKKRFLEHIRIHTETITIHFTFNSFFIYWSTSFKYTLAKICDV